jgi:OOP family OmpA-OmpF porin
MKKIAGILLLLGLASCQSYSLQELRKVNPTGSEFQQALAKEYLQLASQEEENYNWADSWHFADKGLSAAYGNDVGPENITDWHIAPDKKPDLEKARDDLLTALKPEVVAAQPALAARAYRYFDCWAMWEERGWQPAKTEMCHSGFDDALAELKQAAIPKAVAAEGGVETTSYIVFFEWNHATLSKTGAQQVDEVAQALAGESGYEVVLNGHTDTTGLEKYNLTLSKRRAESVEKRLIQGGIDPDVIKIFAFGESDPKVPTADGVDEPRNRRVEIFIE